MKPFTAISIGLFILVAIAHLFRLVFGWEVTVDDVSVPIWVSIVGVIIPGMLAVLLYREMKQ